MVQTGSIVGLFAAILSNELHFFYLMHYKLKAQHTSEIVTKHANVVKFCFDFYGVYLQENQVNRDTNESTANHLLWVTQIAEWETSYSLTIPTSEIEAYCLTATLLLIMITFMLDCYHRATEVDHKWREGSLKIGTSIHPSILHHLLSI